MDFKAYMDAKVQAYQKEFDTLPWTYTPKQIQMCEAMVEARDGVRLKTYIFYPDAAAPALEETVFWGKAASGNAAGDAVRNAAGDTAGDAVRNAAGDAARTPDQSSGAWPVLLQRSCYPHDFPMYEVCGREFARRGYIYVVSFSRGVGGSEGVWEPNVHERDDGLDTVNWLAGQPWCESIGFFGASYLALTGWAMIDAVPDKVKGMYLSVYGTDRFVSAYKDGLFRQDILTAWAMGNAGTKITAGRMESFKYRPQVHVDTDLWGENLPWYRELITHTDFSDDYWQEGFWGMLRQNPSKVKIPVVIEEGWYDHHLGSALSGYESMSDTAKSRCLVRIGAWKHGMEPALSGHVCQRLENQVILPVFHWFETLLKKKEMPASGVSLYVIGQDRWMSEAAWPNEERQLTFYLDTQTQTLGKCAKGAGFSFTYEYDPENPVFSHGAESCFSSAAAIGSLKQPEMNWRPDVVSFISEPFKEAVMIMGKISADLYVSSDAQDTAFSIKVSEVFENGEAYNIRSGITTLAHRGHSDMRQSYTPGTVVRVNIDTWDIAWMVKAGSRLRLDVSSSDFPQYCAHSNYPGVWSLQERTKKARQTIWSGGSTPSVLSIPVKAMS